MTRTRKTDLSAGERAWLRENRCSAAAERRRLILDGAQPRELDRDPQFPTGAAFDMPESEDPADVFHDVLSGQRFPE